MPSVRLRVDPQLRFLLRRDRRVPEFAVRVSSTDTVGHVVQMVGIPLTEVGGLRVDGAVVEASSRPAWNGDESIGTGTPGASVPLVHVVPLPLPQRTRSCPPRFILDVHLGSLARRLRLLGLDTAYETDAGDAHLVERAAAEGRVLLGRDRGLLGRTALPEGALVRGSRTDAQLAEVLRRFVPALEPWTRCVRCNGDLVPADVEEVADALEGRDAPQLRRARAVQRLPPGLLARRAQRSAGGRRPPGRGGAEDHGPIRTRWRGPRSHLNKVESCGRPDNHNPPPCLRARRGQHPGDAALPGVSA